MRSLNNKRFKTEKSWEALMNSFTDDLWTLILLRLPLKSLLGFKSVSKSWLSIISSHHFAISHLAIAPKDDRIHFAKHKLGTCEEEATSYSLFHLDSGRVLKNFKFPLLVGDYPFEVQSRLIGSDCGIICTCVPGHFLHSPIITFDIFLWNPATKHSKIIPRYTIPDHFDRQNMLHAPAVFGFGFDHIALDFKVLRLESHTQSAEVYSTNTNVWRKIQLLQPSKISYNDDFRVCLHGFLFALGFQTGITAFNLNKEVFTCDINLPVSSFGDTSNDDSLTQICVGEYKDSLAIIISAIHNGEIKLWTLDDEACLCGGGVQASWTKVHNIDIGVPVDSFEVLFNNIQFLLIEKDGDRMLYNFNTKVTTHIPEYPKVESRGIFKYTRSMFSLVGFKQVKWAVSSSSWPDLWDWDE